MTIENGIVQEEIENQQVKINEVPKGFAMQIAALATAIAKGTVMSVTGDTADSGTTDGATTIFRLIQSGQNFETSTKEGYLVTNTTDSTYAFVKRVVSDTELELTHNIMATGENYTIKKDQKAITRTGAMVAIGICDTPIEADSDTNDVTITVLDFGEFREDLIVDGGVTGTATSYLKEMPGIYLVPRHEGVADA